MTLTAVAMSVTLMAAPEPPRFGIETEQVRLDVVVSRKGEPVSGLTAEDFVVLDEGVPQPVAMASRDERSVHAVLALDLSGSMSAKDRLTLRRAAAAFLDRLGASDKATLLTFTHELHLVRGPDDPAAVKAALDELDDNGSTALYDAVFAALTLAGGAEGRPVVLVFTDGLDQISSLAPAAVLETARALEATLYVVSSDAWPEPADGGPAAFADLPADTPEDRRWAATRNRPPSGPTFRTGPRSRDVLRRAVHDTGGRIWSGSRLEGLQEDFERVLSEVKSRYLLVYDPPEPRAPGWHKVEVRLKKRKGDVRARQGYFSSAP